MAPLHVFTHPPPFVPMHQLAPIHPKLTPILHNPQMGPTPVPVHTVPAPPRGREPRLLVLRVQLALVAELAQLVGCHCGVAGAETSPSASASASASATCCVCVCVCV